MYEQFYDVTTSQWRRGAGLALSVYRLF